jgi:hypothetical protein
MAVYMQGSRRRWVIVAVGVVALLVGIGIGYVIGNNTAKTSADVVAESRSKGEDAATALQRLPIEYEQAVSASGESSATITGAIDEAIGLLNDAYAASPWLGAALRQPPLAAIALLKADVASKVAPDVFQHDVDQAVAAIDAAFGIDSSTG